MKRYFFFVLLLTSVFCTGIAKAQSFTVAHDTMYVAASGTTSFHDDIIPLIDSVSIKWQVVANNFPPSTYGSTIFCDKDFCYTYGSIGMTDTITTTPNYLDSTSNFSFSITLDTPITSGTYFITVRMSNDSIPSDTARETYLLTFPTAVQNVNQTATNISLYPNPSVNELNVNFTGSDAVAIAIYDITGKQLYNYKVQGNTAKLNVQDLAAGTYFIRLLNNANTTIATRRFVKQ